MHPHVNPSVSDIIISILIHHNFCYPACFSRCLTKYFLFFLNPFSFFHLTSQSALPLFSASPSASPHSLWVPKLPKNLCIGFPPTVLQSLLYPVLSLCLSASHRSAVSLSATLSLTLASPFSKPLILALSVSHLPFLLLNFFHSVL